MAANSYAARQRAQTDSKVLAALESGVTGAADLARATGRAVRTIQQAIERLKAEGKVRIANYERTVSDWRPLYGLGNEPDAKDGCDASLRAQQREVLPAVVLVDLPAGELPLQLSTNN